MLIQTEIKAFNPFLVNSKMTFLLNQNFTKSPPWMWPNLTDVCPQLMAHVTPSCFPETPFSGFP